MKAAVLVGPSKVQVQDLPIPQVKAGEIAIKPTLSSKFLD